MPEWCVPQYGWWAVGAVVPVTVYYSVNEAASVGEEEEAENARSLKVCYNPAVELGGKLTAVLTAPVITLFFVFYLLVLMSYMSVSRHIGRSRRNTPITASQSLLGRVLRNIVLIQVTIVHYDRKKYFVFSTLKYVYYIFK